METAPAAETKSAKRKSVWPFALVAIVVAIIWATLYLASNAHTLPRADGTPRGDARAISAMVTTAVIPAILTWLAFHFLFFRKRASLGKSLVVLLIMAIATPVVTLGPSGFRPGQAAAIQRQIADDTTANLSSLSQQLRADVAALELPGNVLATVHSPRDIDAALGLAQRLQILHNNYIAAVDAELARTRERIDAAELTAGQKQRALQELDAAFGPRSEMQRASALAKSAGDAAHAILVFLRDNRSHWTRENGQFVFDNQRLLDQFTALARTHDEVATQLVALQQEPAGQRSRENPSAEAPPTPTDSAPQPPQ